MKKIFYIFVFLTLIVFLTSINIFLKLNSNFNHIIGVNINIALYLFITFLCIIRVNSIFKKSNLKESKNYRKDMKTVFANSFFSSSLISIISACIIYGFSKNIFQFLNLKEGLINYTNFVSKIWFISSPFIGLEVVVFRYFQEIEYYKKPIFILIFKFILFILLSLFLFTEKKINCFIYAKPFCDLVLLVYYTRICFDATLVV